jgi:hypothetical protein
LVIHPPSNNTLSAASGTPGAAAAHQYQQKWAAYGKVEPHGYPFVPFSVETYGCLGWPAMKLLHSSGDKAAGLDGIIQASFVAGAMRELSLGLRRSISLIYRASVGMFAQVSGTGIWPGMDMPTEKHVM